MRIINIPEQKKYRGRVFPLTIAPNPAGAIAGSKDLLVAWMTDNRPCMDTLLRQHRVSGT